MKQTILTVMIVISLSLVMTGCVAPTGEWDIDGTVKHTDDGIAVTPTPEVVYVTQTPEVIYVTPTPEPISTPTPNPCSGVVCDSRCFGYDLYRTTCVDGHCVKGTLIKRNSSECGYVVPTPVPTPEPTPPHIDLDYQPLYIVLIPEINYTSPSDLRGLRIAKGCYSSHMVYCDMLEEFLEYNGIDPGDVDIVTYKTISTDTLMCGNIDLDESYHVDGCYVTYDNAKTIERRGCGIIVMSSEDMICTPEPTPEETPEPTPEETPEPPLITIEPPIYSGVVRNNGEILDIRITPYPLIAGDSFTIEVDVLNTGTVTTCYELEWWSYDPERWIYSGDMETFVFTATMGDPGYRNWLFELYWDAEWPASNVLLQTATVELRCYTQYEVDNM